MSNIDEHSTEEQQQDTEDIELNVEAMLDLSGVPPGDRFFAHRLNIPEWPVDPFESLEARVSAISGGIASDSIPSLVPNESDEIATTEENSKQSEEISDEEETKPTNIVRVATWNGCGQSNFIKITEEILLPVLDCDIDIYVPHGRRDPRKNGKFNINIYSASGGGAKMLFTPQKIWGITISNPKRSAYQSPELGITVRDDNDYEIFELVENDLYIHHMISQFSTENDLELYRKILNKVVEILEAGYNESLKQYREEIKSRQKDFYIKNCAKRVAARIEALEKSVTDSEYSMKQGSDMIVASIRTKRLSQAQLDGLLPFNEKTIEEYSTEYDRLIKLKKVEDVSISKTGLMTIITTPVSITWNNVTYDLGKYIIQFSMGTDFNSITIKNMDPDKYIRQKGAVSRYVHPHIKSSGECCFGNLITGISKLIGQYQFFHLVQLLIKFIHTVNPAGWYLTVEAWGPDYINPTEINHEQ